MGQSTSQAPCIGLFCDAAGAKALPKSWWSELWRHLALLWPTAIFVEIVPISGAPMLGGTLPAYYSTSIRRLSSVLSVMNLAISADGGVMHLAVASGTCTVGLFKVTDAEVYAPYGHGSFGVVVTRQSAEAIAHYIANHCNLQSQSSVAA
jgi:hypothetical protein